MKSNSNVRFIIEIVILSALGIVFEVVSFFRITLWPTELILTFSMIPIFIAAFRWGLKGGITCGLLCDVIPVLFDLVYSPGVLQGMIEYGVSGAILGIAGLFTNKLQEAIVNNDENKIFTYVSLGVIVGGIGQLLVFIASLYLFYRDSIIEGLSFIEVVLRVNTSFLIPPLLVSIVVITLLAVKQSRFILRPNY